ncbi:hypothetical protein J8K84_17835 [Bacteroides fragilis]|jgi:hypothetical protein|uniref:hypothetical protein n=1 Tax=Bacteroides fragilis TaxID=817 RepID=UPI001C73C577|nr:hypothetical protein [Bacteroides fragilis]MCM0252718.1 hypothetical protein [Bacteroides fragilis]MCM0336906.1 hypothetical protein [Bacteroides fragilis]
MLEIEVLFKHFVIYIVSSDINYLKTETKHYETKKSFNCDCRCHIHPVAALLAFCSRGYQRLATCKLKTCIFRPKHLSLCSETLRRFPKTFKSFAGNT